MLKPYIVGGGFIGLAHFALHDRIIPHFTDVQYTRYIASHALTGALICALFFNPIFVFRSSLIGALFGTTRYSIYRESTPKTGFYVSQKNISADDYVNMR